MTKQEALKKACKLWGPKASACLRRNLEGQLGDIYGIYHINSGTYACNDGKGKVHIYANSFQSWEDAFELAKRCYKYWELPEGSEL